MFQHYLSSFCGYTLIRIYVYSNIFAYSSASVSASLSYSVYTSASASSFIVILVFLISLYSFSSFSTNFPDIVLSMICFLTTYDPYFINHFVLILFTFNQSTYFRLLTVYCLSKVSFMSFMSLSLCLCPAH